MYFSMFPELNLYALVTVFLNFSRKKSVSTNKYRKFEIIDEIKKIHRLKVNMKRGRVLVLCWEV